MTAEIPNSDVVLTTKHHRKDPTGKDVVVNLQDLVVVWMELLQLTGKTSRDVILFLSMHKVRDLKKYLSIHFNRI